jgi:adenylate cyclase
MSALLRYELEGIKTEEILAEPLISVGRGETNDVSLADPQASRSHALLRGTGEDQYYLIDLGSTNGTSINGKRVVVPVLLKNGDKIKIGTTSLTFLLPKAEEKTAEEIPEDDDVAGTPTVASIGMEMVQATVLVADISDYTGMSEQLPLSSLARLMGNWFRFSNDIIEKNNGFVDKFIGDAVMACWLCGDENLKVTIKQALGAACELLKMTGELSQAYPLLSKPLRIGVGISTGEAIASGLGSGRPKDYTVMGDSVNLAFRLEKAAKELKGDVAVSYNSFEYFEQSSYKGREKTIEVKGKDEPVRIWLLKANELADILSSL